MLILYLCIYKSIANYIQYSGLSLLSVNLFCIYETSSHRSFFHLHPTSEGRVNKQAMWIICLCLNVKDLKGKKKEKLQQNNIKTSEHKCESYTIKDIKDSHMDQNSYSLTPWKYTSTLPSQPLQPLFKGSWRYNHCFG